MVCIEYRVGCGMWISLAGACMACCMVEPKRRRRVLCVICVDVGNRRAVLFIQGWGRATMDTVRHLGADPSFIQHPALSVILVHRHRL